MKDRTVRFRKVTRTFRSGLGSMPLSRVAVTLKKISEKNFWGSCDDTIVALGIEEEP
jgi:hypothetical protein